MAGCRRNAKSRETKEALSSLARPVSVADGWRVTEEPAPRRDRRVVLLLWLLPLWLVISSLGGMWLYLRKQAAAEEEEQARFTTGISAAGLQDDVGKFLGFVHPINACTAGLSSETFKRPCIRRICGTNDDDGIALRSDFKEC